jgi:hypothetical protein
MGAKHSNHTLRLPQTLRMTNNKSVFILKVREECEDALSLQLNIFMKRFNVAYNVI